MSDAIQALREALQWYEDEAKALAKHMEGGAHTQAVLASLTVLSLDAGRRARAARAALAAYEQQAAAPEHSTAPALAEVTLADPSNITAHIRWLLNPLPIGSLLYEAPAPEHSAEPVAWRVRMQGTDGDGWMLAGKRALLQFIGEPEPLYTAPPKDQP